MLRVCCVGVLSALQTVFVSGIAAVLERSYK